MSTELIVNSSLPEIRIALMESGEIQELQIERASEKGIVGNIYKGKVTRVLPGMQAAFVDIGLEKAAFLYVDDVFVHSDIWEEEEGTAFSESGEPRIEQGEPGRETSENTEATESAPAAAPTESPQVSDSDDFDEEEDESDNDQDPGTPVNMGTNPDDPNDPGQPPETVAPQKIILPKPTVKANDRKKGHARGAGRGAQRSARGRRRPPHHKGQISPKEIVQDPSINLNTELQSSERTESDRAELSATLPSQPTPSLDDSTNRPQENLVMEGRDRAASPDVDENSNQRRPQFREQRSRDRRVRPKPARQFRGPVNIQDLLKEGQEVLVQVAKDPIATKGARLTCHISLPGRHLVCMPTIDHVGVSRRIERDDERRKLRDFVDRNRPRNIGFIVRTASARGQYEKRLKQDIDYLTRLWTEIREKAATTTAPGLVYEDLNAVLRAIRDWVTEDINKIIVDSRYHYNEVLRFVSHFMPAIKHKVELYHGDIPIFDAYNISTELSRALERKVWLKSGGYIVIDQAEALVAIDVNTGRYVGKKNLEDTILKTNLEAVQEIAYQLRLRNCGGIIILDFIDMEKDENRHRVYRALDEALKKDRSRPSILKISELGLVEMTRKRTRDTITRTLCESCSHCEGKGFIKNKMTVAYEVLREVERTGIERDANKILIQANAEVIDILAIDERETVDMLERRYRKQIYLQTVLDFHPEQFEVVTEKNQRGERFQPLNVTQNTAQSSGDLGRHRHSSKDQPREHESQGDLAPIKLDLETPITTPTPPQEKTERLILTLPTPTIQPIQLSPVVPVNSDPSSTTGESSTQTQASQATPSSAASSDDFMEEEDRLAFLRAQAAQDAALANAASAQRPGGGGTFTRPHHRNEGGKIGSWGGRGGGAKRRGSGGPGGGRRGRSGVRYSRPYND